MDDIIQELRQDFAQLTPETLRELSMLYERLDWQKLVDAFHKLKGAAAVCRLADIQHSAASCQDAAQREDKSALDSSYQQLTSLLSEMMP